jgi:hypothetical protein
MPTSGTRTLLHLTAPALERGTVTMRWWCTMAQASVSQLDGALLVPAVLIMRCSFAPRVLSASLGRAHAPQVCCCEGSVGKRNYEVVVRRAKADDLQHVADICVDEFTNHLSIDMKGRHTDGLLTEFVTSLKAKRATRARVGMCERMDRLLQRKNRAQVSVTAPVAYLSLPLADSLVP